MTLPPPTIGKARPESSGPGVSSAETDRLQQNLAKGDYQNREPQKPTTYSSSRHEETERNTRTDTFSSKRTGS